MGTSRDKQVKPSRVRLPITAPLLCYIKQQLELGAHRDCCVLWAVCCTDYFGFFCLGELLPLSAASFNPRLHLARGDMAVDSQETPRMVRFHLKQTNMDQFGKGVDAVFGRTDRDVSRGHYLSLNWHTWEPPGPVLSYRGWCPTDKVNLCCRAEENPHSNYTGHSFRIGAATPAALAGVEDSTIQLLRCWQSAAFLCYMRTPRKGLLKCPRH